MRTRSLGAGLCLLLLGACGADQGALQVPVETVAERAWTETLNVNGEIKAASNTALNIPGSGWESRHLVEMVPDGSIVKKGQVVARFDAPEARAALSQDEAELLRKLIGERGIAATADIRRAELASDSAKVDADLALSHRYAEVDLSIFEKNKILDTLVDIGYLNHKSRYLSWKTQQVGARTGAESALLLSQKESVSVAANQKRKSLAELELIAPHDGVFLLTRGWDGTVPTVGSNQWAGSEFGSLPDLNKMVARFSVPEGQAFGLKPGLAVRVRFAGTGAEIALKVSKVDQTASTKSRESPVKYSGFEADIDLATAGRLGLKPGQALTASVQLVARAKALTVPNLALVQDGAAFYVLTQGGKGAATRQQVVLGARGPIRSEILSGLAAGTKIRLLPEEKKEGTS
jgi:HlyD family secretion protein